MDEWINILQNFGLPVGVMIWLMTQGQKILAELACEMKKVSDSNTKLTEEIKATFQDIKNVSLQETNEIIKAMVNQIKK
jgi:hypothetical protein